MLGLNLAVRIESFGLPMSRALETAARIGAGSIELNARNGIDPSSLSDTGLRSFRKMLDDLNLTVAGVRFPTRRGYDHLDGLDRRVDATKKAMMLAYRLGATSVINSLGPIPESPDDARYETLKSVVDDLGRYGAKVGAFLTAETGSESGQTMMQLLETSENGYVGVAVNPGQWVINQFNVTESVEAVKARVQYVCVVDGVVDLSAGRGLSVPVGQGIVDFPQLLGQLEEVQYRGPLVIGRAESSPAELQNGIAYLRSL